MAFAKHVGKYYSGFDDKNHIVVEEGQIIEVSDAKLAQLKEDFPKDWEELKEEDAQKLLKAKADSEKTQAEKDREAEAAHEKDEADLRAKVKARKDKETQKTARASR